MKKLYILIGVIILVAGGIYLASSSLRDSDPAPETATTTEEVWACHSDARLCPDGSSVGRRGPTCEFEACPSPDATSARIETYLGGRDGGLNLILRPQKVTSDSRCAPDVQCIWAGTVEVKTIVETKVAHGELIFKLGEPQTVGDLTVTLVEVRPSHAELAKNPEHGYWFVFEARKK